MVIPTKLVQHLTALELLFAYQRRTRTPSTLRQIVLRILVLSTTVALLVPANLEAGSWDATIGAGAIYGPKYPGAESYEVSPLPYLDITWRDRLFLRTDRGLGGYLVNQKETEASAGAFIEEYYLGLSIRPSEDRDEDDDNRLDGLGDVDLSAEVGIFGGFEVGPVGFEAELYQDVGSGHEGLRGEVSLALGGQVAEGFSLEAGPFLQFGDSQYLESFFGVTGRQAARSGLSEYDAGSGLYGAGAEIMARYQFSESWAVLGFVEYRQLAGDAADSPIVENEASVEVGAFITYRF